MKNTIKKIKKYRDHLQLYRGKGKGDINTFMILRLNVILHK